MIKKILQFAAFSLAIAIGGILLMPKAAHAAYDGTNLIDDSIFRAYNSMSEAEIQAFLTARGGALASYQDPTSSPANQTAAHIIYDAAQTWGVSPRVIMATLQKEQSLITDTSPIQSQWDSAMGYGCPDSGGCNPAYKGLWRQVGYGTWQLRQNFERSAGRSWVGGDGVTYNGSYACANASSGYTPGLVPGNTVQFLDGTGMSVYISNQGTASLYCYTPHPYHPTSPYYSGSYNFVTFFETWWGSTHVPSLDWQVVGSPTYSSGSRVMVPGQRQTLSLTIKNTGGNTWSSNTNPVRLGTAANRWDAFHTGGTNAWVDGNRAATIAPTGGGTTVAPGATGTFTWDVVAPAQTGYYPEFFVPVAEGLGWFPDYGFGVPLEVQMPTYTYGSTSFTVDGSPYSGSIAMEPGEVKNIVMSITNTGNATWSNTTYPTKLATSGNRTSAFQNSWESSSRVDTLDQASRTNGQVGTFSFSIKAPAQGGTYDEAFNVVAEGLTWFNISNPSLHITVSPKTYTYAVAGKTVNNVAYNGSTISMSPGDIKTLGVTVTNTGTATWSNTANPVMIATSANRASVFHTGGTNPWIDYNRAAKLVEASVAPGGTGTFVFDIKAPNQGGTYNETFDLVAEGLTWFNITNFNFSIQVTPQTYTYSIVSQQYNRGSGFTNGTTIDLVSGNTGQLKLTVQNTGTATWSNTVNPVRIGTSANLPSPVQGSGWVSNIRPATLIESSVAPGGTGTFVFNVLAPAGSHNYASEFNLVAEGLTWFNIIHPTWFVNAMGSFTYQSPNLFYSTGGSFTPVSGAINLARGATATIRLVANNNGTATWSNSGNYPVTLAVSGNTANHALSVGSGWLDAPGARIVRLQESSVAPSLNGTFQFTITAPNSAWSGSLPMELVAENAGFFNILTPTITVNVP